MAKDRIDRTELGDKILALTQNTPDGQDPLREIGEMVLNFISEAEAAAQVGAEPYERTDERPPTGTDTGTAATTHGWVRSGCASRSCAKAASCRASSSIANGASRRW